jgi:hypothetical protein
MHGREYTVVFSGQFEDSAVLRRDGEGRWSCTTCEKNKKACEHMTADDGTSRLPPADREELEARLNKFLDPDGKTRRLTCLSRLLVPQTVYTSEYAPQYNSTQLSPEDRLAPTVGAWLYLQSSDLTGSCIIVCLLDQVLIHAAIFGNQVYRLARHTLLAAHSQGNRRELESWPHR